jgi:hypothetical protein
MEAISILITDLWLVDEEIIADGPNLYLTYRANEMMSVSLLRTFFS